MSVSSQAGVSETVMIRLLLSDGSTMLSRCPVTHAPRCIVSQRVLVIETKGFLGKIWETSYHVDRRRR